MAGNIADLVFFQKLDCPGRFLSLAATSLMDHKLCYFVWTLSIDKYIFSFLVNERFNAVKLEDPTKIGQNETPSAGENSNDVTVAKG